MTSSWCLADIPFHAVDAALVRDREELFILVAGASFVEIASDLYASNLAQHYAGDVEVTTWLQDTWEHEEVQHGHALKAYVRAVWPEFDWEEAFADFMAEYATLCDLEHFEPSPGLEMVARCVIEMGTASFYRALSQLAGEPVLSGLCERIQNDEIGHYKYFLRYFQRYNLVEKQGRWRILRALTDRLIEVRGDDADCAFWHAFHHRDARFGRDSKEFRAAFSGATRAIRVHFPSSMAVKMLTKPLNLPKIVARAIETPLASISQRLILR